MKVSLITVCFNSEETILDTIRSVEKQSYVDIEYIIIDGASTDRTIDIINNNSSRVSCVVSASDKGIYDAMNKGLALATGDVIGILNADDFYPHKNVITSVVNILEENSNVDMVLGNVDFVESHDLTSTVRNYSSFKFSPWKLRFGFMPAHPASFIKVSAYKKVGNYKWEYKIAADFDIFVRMIIVHKLSYTKLNKTLVRMRLGGVSTSGIKSYITTTKEMLRSLNENKVYSNVLMVLLRLPIKFFQSF